MLKLGGDEARITSNRRTRRHPFRLHGLERHFLQTGYHVPRDPELVQFGLVVFDIRGDCF